MDLNPQQLIAANALQGCHVTIAGPGSGKTTVFVQRFMNLLEAKVPFGSILNLTFTNSAAKLMCERVNLTDPEKVFKTFHAFALDLIKKERDHLPFVLCDSVLPWDLQDYQLLFDLRDSYRVINWRELQERISCWKSKGVPPDQAIEEEGESNGIGYIYALAYRDYETRCRQQGWLDFDSLIDETLKLLQTNEDVRSRWQRDYIAVDECQDTDVRQFKILQLLFKKNIFVVGDEKQCQPPGTVVDVLKKPRLGRTKARVISVPIEFLRPDTDRLVSWDKTVKRVRLGKGRKFKKAVRQFDGNLLTIYSGGKSTRVTPDHLVWTKFNTRALDKGKKNHFVYLMWKEGFGFRIGTSRLRRTSGSNKVSQRGYQEGANRMWILSLAETMSEAMVQEEILSLKYGIPECCFNGSYAHSRKTKKQIKRVFAAANPIGGFMCLKDRGLLFDSPLVRWPSKLKQTKFHGYFRTVAANLLPGFMDLPTRKTYESAVIKSVTREKYSGPVYSLEVEKDHTYVADGIPVGNCIYEWRSAQAGNLTNFARLFPEAKKLFLGQNYRSSGNIVQFLREIAPLNDGLEMFTDNPPGEPVYFTKYRDEDEEARHILDSIIDPEHTAIIARTNRQLYVYHRLCTMKSIKYKILGKKDYWDSNEIKKLLSHARQSNSRKPASEVLADLIREHNMVAKYKDSATRDSNPVDNLNSIVQMAANKGTIGEFLAYLRKKTYARKAEQGLTLSTVHQSKGTEYKNVYLIGASEGKLPHKDGEINEERRILFVACSRAADVLKISYIGNISGLLLDYEDRVVKYGEPTEELE